MQSATSVIYKLRVALQITKKRHLYLIRLMRWEEFSVNREDLAAIVNHQKLLLIAIKQLTIKQVKNWKVVEAKSKWEPPFLKPTWRSTKSLQSMELTLDCLIIRMSEVLVEVCWIQLRLKATTIGQHNLSRISSARKNSPYLAIVRQSATQISDRKSHNLALEPT